MNDSSHVKMESILQEERLYIEKDKSRIISMTKKVAQIDAIDFFAAAEAISLTRTFWASPHDEFILVGVGSIADIGAYPNRFEATKQAWEEILNKTKVYNPYDVPGTGLITLGGMAFDTEEKKTELWENYSDSQFHIPEFTLAIIHQQAYLTINVQLSSHDDVKQLLEKIWTKENHLLTVRYTNKQSEPTVLNKWEVQPEQWKKAVYQARGVIRAKHLEKIVMARELRLKFTNPIDVQAVLRKLLSTQPTSYVFAFTYGEDSFVGATPERLIQVKKEKVLSMCLAGTAPRGHTQEQDEQLSSRFLHDEKNLAEHRFVVEMIRTNIERFCKTLDIPSHPKIYRLKNLQHLYTPVQGILQDDATIFDLVGQLHPTPALGGTPTQKALAFIRDHEILNRGWYGAPLGFVDSNGFGEFIVGIRSGLIRKDEASLFAGCGIVADSDIDKEYEETRIKFSPMLHVLESD